MKDIADSLGGARLINRLNKIKVVNLIRNNDSISRADVARETGLSAPTVSRIVEDLMAEGLVREIGEGASQGGRRPTMLRFSAHDNFIIGIDLGTTQIYGVLSDFDARIVAEIRRPTPVEEGFPSVMARTSQIIEELRSFPGVLGKRIHGIGMAVAGLINRDKNIVEFSPDFHWYNVDVVSALSQKNGIPVIFDNVTRVMALGEMLYGVGKEHKNFICVNVGYGIGAGVILNGKPLYGHMGMAGEFGHITLAKDSRIQCECGNYGCLEALSSGNAIAKAAQNELGGGAKSALREMAGGEYRNITAEMVGDAARQGDPLARAVFDQAMEYLGVGIAGLINLFSPEAVIIGGGVAQAGDLLFEKVRQTVRARSLNKISSTVLIKPAIFGLRAAVMGAISLILSEVLNLRQPHLSNSA